MKQGLFASAPSCRRRQLLLASAIVAALGAGSVAGAAVAARRAPTADSASVPASPPGVYAFEQDGFRYTYHAPSGAEALVALSAAPNRGRNVIGDHADVALRLRRLLESRLGVESLEELRAEHADSIRRLRSLGYL